MHCSFLDRCDAIEMNNAFLMGCSHGHRQRCFGCPYKSAENLTGIFLPSKKLGVNFIPSVFSFNMTKTKIMMCGLNQNPLHNSGRFPCGVCRKGVGISSIFCEVSRLTAISRAKYDLSVVHHTLQARDT